jgi:hypothetical protein
MKPCQTIKNKKLKVPTSPNSFFAPIQQKKYKKNY